MIPATHTGITRTTSYKVVLPFYLYAGLAFLAASVLLFFSTTAFTQHYFHPRTLAITHIMALGWGTMIILGASHQLVPVLIEGKLYSNVLAYLSFGFAAVGIPVLCYGFFVFSFNGLTQAGALCIIAAVLFYIINIGISMVQSGRENVQAVFVFTAMLWLLITIIVGYFLLFNFTHTILSKDSLHYLPLHAHLGIIGWFLLLVMGVASKLIPLFLISKYQNREMLWWVFGLTNFALISFIVFFLFFESSLLYFIPVAAIATALVLFAFFCSKAYKDRLRKKVDNPVKISLLSVIMMGLPLLALAALIGISLTAVNNYRLVLAYGFCILFGWITAIILGMTFKTLPFIIWNKIYHARAKAGRTPNPKDLFSDRVFKWMCLFYLAGFMLFTAGILTSLVWMLQAGAVLLLLVALFYNGNMWKALAHKPKDNE